MQGRRLQDNPSVLEGVPSVQPLTRTHEGRSMSHREPFQDETSELTLNAISLDELQHGAPPAERWILSEIKEIRKHARSLDAHRRRAMAGIVERFHGRLLRYATSKLASNREDAEDVVQEVYQDLERLLPRVTTEEHLRKLLFKLAKHKCADAVARNRRMTLSNEIHLPAEEWRFQKPPQEAEPKEEEESSIRLRRAIRHLPKLEDRILLTLSLDYHMPVKHIAKVLEISEGACKMRRHRARRKLRQILEQEKALSDGES